MTLKNMKSYLNLVLCYPQIPQNTGCIARTCAATFTNLHLIEPLGFELTESRLKRAGVDYWPYVSLTKHTGWSEFLKHKKNLPGRLLAFSPRGLSNYLEFQYEPNDWIIHGRESDGLPNEIMADCDHILYIPMFSPDIRSLNLSVSASLSLYEGIRALNYCQNLTRPS
ncbi:unnamed protein product [Blepharisma stoltei]|uniref:tRNA/rRNA methyltransferase SpoU type domain-containing protein n=1 Tax=Blepharisma stoltei TaxID=1481888 RepID=A0AAU9IER0_9CILI|nr:unnamed protein product [Blepharisma stoltei]